MSTVRRQTDPAKLSLDCGETARPASYHRIVVKAGTSVLTGEAGDALDPNVMRDLVSQIAELQSCLLYTSPSPRDGLLTRMPSSA